MTAASQLPPELARRTDWTADDLAGLPRAYAKARIPTYWMVEPTGGQISLIERLLGADGDFRYGEATSDVYTTDRPWKVTLDLPGFECEAQGNA